jgi:ketosteroid isomerase-like protein
MTVQQEMDKQVAEELKQVGRQWDAAIVENDIVKIGSFMAEEWVIVGTEGGITSKSNFLEYVKSGELFHNTMDFEDVRVKIYGDTGVVTSKGTSAGTYRGEPFSYYEWSTNVYVKTDGHWRCVLTMLTPAEK